MTQQDKVMLKGIAISCLGQVGAARAMASAPAMVQTPQGVFPVMLNTQLGGICNALEAILSLVDKTIEKA